MTYSGQFCSALAMIGCITAAPAFAGNAPSLSEAAGRYTISSSSRIAFVVEQVGGGGIKGRFARFAGSFNLKPGDLPHSSVTFDLQPASVTTGQQRIDDFLKSPAVFDADHFSTISFRSSQVQQTGPDTARVTGTLSAKGRSAPESFDVKLTSWNGRAIGFDVSGNIYRSRYAMDVGTPIYSNVVRFDMAIEGQRR